MKLGIARLITISNEKGEGGRQRRSKRVGTRNQKSKRREDVTGGENRERRQQKVPQEPGMEKKSTRETDNNKINNNERERGKHGQDEDEEQEEGVENTG